MVAIRSIPRYPIPDDKEFAPRSVNDTEGRAADAAAADAASDGASIGASNEFKLAYGDAQAQHLANETNCAVKRHFHELPGCQHTWPTMLVHFIPGDPNAQLPEIEPPV